MLFSQHKQNSLLCSALASEVIENYKCGICTAQFQFGELVLNVRKEENVLQVVQHCFLIGPVTFCLRDAMLASSFSEFYLPLWG